MKRTNSLIEQGEKYGIDYDKFQEKLEKVLIMIFPKISSKHIKIFVQEVIRTDAAFISKETVQSYASLCEKCGVCCEDHECPHLVGNLCGIRYRKVKSKGKLRDMVPVICRNWPYFEIPGENHGVQFCMGCPYAFKTILYECMKILKKSDNNG